MESETSLKTPCLREPCVQTTLFWAFSLRAWFLVLPGIESLGSGRSGTWAPIQGILPDARAVDNRQCFTVAGRMLCWARSLALFHHGGDGYKSTVNIKRVNSKR